MSNDVNGKICYLILPAASPEDSASFYASVFGWSTRRHDDGSLAFDDPAGCVSGMWVTGRPAATDPGMEVHIMVRDAAATEAAIVAGGGSIVQPSDPGQQEAWGLFRDPYGNLLGFYQHPGMEGDG
ncbi:MAG: VOC family protein [Thermomicrobiales bacterium]